MIKVVLKPVWLIHFKPGFFLLLLILFLSIMGSAQPDGAKTPKLSPLLALKLQTITPQQLLDIMVVSSDPKELLSFITRETVHARAITIYEPAKILLMQADKGAIVKLLTSELVVFIDEKRIPKEELLTGSIYPVINKINKLQHVFPSWNGNTLGISIKENKMDTTDIDLKGRYMPATLASSIINSHATIMATLAAGGGNSYYLTKAPGWGGIISSSSFATLLPDADAAYQQYNIQVQNHSYGTGIENFYGADAMAYDISTINNPSLVHIFSAGNSGTSTSTTGNYSTVDSFANITGSFKMAKNIITVGHVDSFNTVLPLSSNGPAFDGRVKPELVAFGQDGSSGAAALVSGTALALQQAYKESHGNLMPSSALIKAILLNSADDVQTPGIDYRSGYGSLNAFEAMNTLSFSRYFSGTVTNAGVQNFNLVIPAGAQLVKLTLVWNDPAALANAPKALVNDLDIELQLPATGENWKPFVLSSFPKKDSLRLLPTRKRDSLNNAEQVSLGNPAAGIYNIQVKGFDVRTSSQSFFIAYQVDMQGSFDWENPTGSDNIFYGEPNIIRWKSNGVSLPGKLEYTTDNLNWQLIDNAVVMSKGFYTWNAPPVFTLAKLRMTAGPQTIVSDTFTISSPLQIRVGFNCPDSFLLYWNKVPGISSYQVYKVGDKYLEPLLVTPDTLIVLGKNGNSSLYYTVAPLFGNKPGVKSISVNYTTQGVACYIRSFLANLVNNSGELLLEIGTTYAIQSITWEKLTVGGFVPLQVITSINGLFYQYHDLLMHNGVNTYRVKIVLADGRIIYSFPESIYFFGNTPYIIFPNPSAQDQPISIISKEVNDDLLQVYSTDGTKLFEMVLDDVIKNFPTGRWSKGLYLARITRQGKLQAVLKFVIQ